MIGLEDVMKDGAFLLRDDILVKLPLQTDDLVKSTKSGLFINTLYEQAYNPTHGTVIKKSVRCVDVQINDEVFFWVHEWQNAKHQAWGNPDPRFKGMSYNHRVYAIKDGDDYYMIIPESSLTFIQRGDTLIPLNDYAICEPIDKETVDVAVNFGGKEVLIGDTTISNGGLVLLDMSKDKHQQNRVKIFCPPPGRELSNGDIVWTLKHCDLTPENNLNNPILPKKYFFVEYQDIVAKEINGELLPLA